MMNYKIQPGVGIGLLKFGMDRKDIEHILGEPNEIEENNDVGNEIDITWRYFDFNVSVYFDEENDYKLGCIEVDNQYVNLFNLYLKDISLKNATLLFKSNNIYDGKLEQLDDEIILQSEKLGVDLYFENEVLNAVQISPLFIDDDTIKWPN